MEDYIEMLKRTFLCNGLSEEEFLFFLSQANVQVRKYKKSEFILREMEKPDKLFLLASDYISVYRDTMSGKVLLIADITDKGDIFGEVYLYMKKTRYDLNAIAKTDSTVLTMDSRIFEMFDKDVPTAYYKITTNLLTMFARKAYTLNTKIQVLNSGLLRQRVVRYLMNCKQEDGVVMLALTREEMADFLNTTRPSLSRELSSMAKEGLIEMKGRKVKLLNREGLDDCL